MVIIAGLAVLAAAISFVGLRAPKVRRSARDVMCPVDGTPLQPDPVECPPPEPVGAAR
jgi:hypothetical protein